MCVLRNRAIFFLLEDIDKSGLLEQARHCQLSSKLSLNKNLPKVTKK